MLLKQSNYIWHHFLILFVYLCNNTDLFLVWNFHNVNKGDAIYRREQYEIKRIFQKIWRVSLFWIDIHYPIQQGKTKSYLPNYNTRRVLFSCKRTRKDVLCASLILFFRYQDRFSVLAFFGQHIVNMWCDQAKSVGSRKYWFWDIAKQTKYFLLFPSVLETL